MRASKRSMSTLAPYAVAAAIALAMAYLALTKPDVSFLVVLTTLAGYALGTVGPLDWLRMAQTVFGTTLVAAGTSALNHYLERDSDARMRRTASRPLPSGVLRSRRSALVRRRASRAAGTLDLLLATNVLAAAAGRAHLRHAISASTRRSRRAPRWPRWSARFPARCRR